MLWGFICEGYTLGDNQVYDPQDMAAFTKWIIARNEIRTDLIERIIKDLEISGSTTVIRSYNKKPVNIICRTC